VRRGEKVATSNVATPHFADKIEFIIAGNTVATDTITVPYDPYYQKFCGTITGSDPTTSSGDEVKVKIKALSGCVGGIIWGDGSGCDSYITIPPPTEIHDMAVTDVYTIPSSPTVGQATTINVTVKNEGTQAESNVPVKAYVDGSQVDSTKYVSLSAGQSTTKSFSWTPSIAKKYSVKGEVGVVSGETDTADNTKTIDVYVSLKDWLSVSLTTGTVNPGGRTNITVTFNTTSLSPDDYYANINITSNDPDESVVTVPVHLIVRPGPLIFDTGSGTYPSIFGTHIGTITPSCNVNVSRMYTYPYAGTGGHTEYVRIYGNGVDVSKTWSSYAGDY